MCQTGNILKYAQNILYSKGLFAKGNYFAKAYIPRGRAISQLPTALDFLSQGRREKKAKKDF